MISEYSIGQCWWKFLQLVNGELVVNASLHSDGDDPPPLSPSFSGVAVMPFPCERRVLFHRPHDPPLNVQVGWKRASVA
jgi:hypothetical protein